MGGVLAGIDIDIPNADLPEDVQAKIDRDNAKGISTVMKQCGINQLFNVSYNATATFGTSYAVVPGMQIAFVTSGGYTEIDALLAVSTPAATNAEAQILLDGNEVDFAAEGGELGISVLRLKLRYAAFLVKGPHTVTINIRGNGGTLTASSGRPSRLWGKETVL